MATTYVTIRRRMRELLGERPNATTSGAGNAGGTTAPDTALAVFDDDHFNDSFYLLLTSGTNSGENRPVSDFATSGGVMTVPRAYTGQVASGVSYELLRYSPDDYLAAHNMASWQLYPRLHRVVYNEEHVVGSILINPSFETAIAAADWVSSGSPTITYLTTSLIHGRSIQLVGTGGAGVEGLVYQDIPERLEDMRGMGITFGGLVRATAANTARLRIDWDGTNFTSNAYHTGDDEWQWQEIVTTIPSTSTRIRPLCAVTGTDTAQFDAMYCILHTSPLRTRYDIGTTMKDGPHALYVARSKTANPLYDGWEDWPFYGIDGASDPNSNNDSGPANSVGRYVSLTQLPSAGQRLRMVGMAPLTAAATDSTNIEVDQPQVTRLAVRACVNLLEMQLAKLGSRASEEIERSLARLSALDIEMDKRKSLLTQQTRVMSRNLIKGIW